MDDPEKISFADKVGKMFKDKLLSQEAVQRLGLKIVRTFIQALDEYFEEVEQKLSAIDVTDESTEIAEPPSTERKEEPKL